MPLPYPKKAPAIPIAGRLTVGGILAGHQTILIVRHPSIFILTIGPVRFVRESDLEREIVVCIKCSCAVANSRGAKL